MPYIKREDREKFGEIIALAVLALVRFEKNEPFKTGELNYLISSIAWHLFESNRSYQTANDIIGVLECAKHEFYRRVVFD